MTNEPAWVNDLIEAVSGLTHQQIRTLISCLAENSPPVSAANLQRTLLMTTSDSGHLARRLRSALEACPASASEIQLALSTIARMTSLRKSNSDSVEVVCTAPDRFGVSVRTTLATARELIQNSREEIFALGYVFTGGAHILVADFAAARSRGIQVNLIGNRMLSHLPAIHSVWPDSAPPPAVFSREAREDDPMAALHAKLLLSDRNNALVTSANFSYHGMHENIEIGVRVDAPAIERLRAFIVAMINTGEVQPVSW